MKRFLCEVCSRSFRDDAHTHCSYCHRDIHAIQELRIKLARIVPKLYQMGTLDGAIWALKHLLKKAEQWKKTMMLR